MDQELKKQYPLTSVINGVWTNMDAVRIEK